MTDVTIVVSTYNKPAVLKCAIQSVLLQTFQNWRLYIIGDACEKATEELVSSFTDPRIQYCNLPQRCGEQSGPNSAGIAAAQTDYVALLNQDDIWFPNHLETALGTLTQQDKDFYCAGSVTTSCVLSDEGKKAKPFFLGKNPPKRTFETAFFSHPDYLEPASAWVFSKKVFDKIGSWAPASTIHRTPLEDWLLRLWREDARYMLSDDLTVIKCNMSKAVQAKATGQPAELYNMPEIEQEIYLSYLASGKHSDLRAVVDTQVQQAKHKWGYRHLKRFQGTKLYPVFEQLVTREAAGIFWETGHDAYTDFCHLAGLQKGESLKTLLKRRTGEALPVHNNWADMIHYAQTSLAA